VSIENDLKQINKIQAGGLGEDFKLNLRKRLLNLYESENFTQLDSVKTLPERSFDLVRRFVSFVKVQSAFTLSAFLMSILSFGVVASYIALPSSIKQRLFSRVGEVEILANIEGADVYLNGEYIGKTPIQGYSIKEGNYTIRVEKDGFDSYSESVLVSSDMGSKVLAELSLDKFDKVNWLSYVNETLGLSFKYPQDWTIAEVVNGNSLEVILGFERSELVFRVGEEVQFNLQNIAGIRTFQKEISVVGNDTGLKRYLQFANDGAFVGGGLFVGLDSRSLVAFYKIAGSEDQILGSETLLIMDDITKSVKVDSGFEIIASDNESSKIVDELVSLEDLDVKELVKDDSKKEQEPVPSIKPVVELAASYVNDVYGYEISYPASWDLSDTRANFPVSSSGYSISTSDGNIEASRLWLKSRSNGRISLLLSFDRFSNFAGRYDLCSTGSQVYEFANGLVLKAASGQNAKYDYQVCNSSSGVLTSKPSANGVVFYGIYWEIDDYDYSVAAFEDFKSIVDSVRFDSGLVTRSINDIKIAFDSSEFGISFKVPYTYKVVEKKQVDCISSSSNNCVTIEIKDSNDAILASISRNANPKSIPESLMPNDIYTVKGQGEDFVFQEYFLRKCESESLCKSDFQFGVSSNQNLEIVYYTKLSSNQLLAEVIKSLQI
jgi:hypothetical protein